MAKLSACKVTVPGAKGIQTVTGKPSPLFPDSIEEFRGIPYGHVPGRWRHSLLRAELPSDNFDATKNGPQCPQPPVFANTKTYQSHLDWPADVVDHEFDCLNLFIIRPSPAALENAGLDPVASLPVYVNIHGGGFGFGAGTDPMWDPTRLVHSSLQQGTPFIAINVNYRLGIFGFGISSEIIDAQNGEGELRGGNFGIGDQRVALRWTSTNIAAFGGDPSKITIAGQSAGSVSVQLHVFEAKFGSQKPLFRRAVQQSGGVKTMGPNSLEIADEKWQDLYSKLDINSTNGSDRLAALLQLSSPDLLAAAVSLQWWMFPPTKDGLTICDRNDGTWLVHFGKNDGNPKESWKSSEEPISILVGDCAEEGFYKDQIRSFTSFGELEKFLQSKSVPVSSQGFSDLMSTYEISSTTPASKLHAGLEQAMTDMAFGFPVENARTVLASNRRFDSKAADGSTPFPTQIRPFRIKFGNPFPGPCYNTAHHCVELLYVYDCFHDDLRRKDKEEVTIGDNLRPAGWASNAELVSSLQALWISFITNDRVQGRELFSYDFDKDRHLYLREVALDKDWQDLKARVVVVEKHHDILKSVADALGSLVKIQ